MGYKILVVDDEDDVRKVLRARFESQGYTVDCAENGEKGLEKVSVFCPDLVLTDVLMPVMDGFEMFKNLKLNPETSHIPVLVLSARGKMEDSFESLGADNFTAKPFDAGELLFKVDQLLKGHRTLDVEQLKERFKLARKNQGDSKKYVLLVGIIDDVREVLTPILTKEGYEVIVAYEFEEVVDKIIEKNPGVIIKNVQIDSISSYELICAFSRIDGFHTRFILFSYFEKMHNAERSVVHKYYSDYLKAGFADLPVLPKYLGAFNSQTCKEELKAAIQSSLK